MLKRMITAFAAASGVTFGLFFIMQMLVSGNDEVNLEDKGFKFIDVVQNVPEQEIRKKEAEVEKPPEVEAPPEDIAIKRVNLDGPTGMDLSINKTNMGSGIEMQGVDLSLTSDGEYLPLVRMEPVYPRRAQERGIEGWVTVEFTVTADGTVADPFVLEAEPENIFNRAALKAVLKFKYKPMVVNGVPQDVEGVRTRFVFQMDKSKKGGR